MAATTEAEPLLRQRARGRGALAVLRAIVTVHTVAIFAQPVSAGRYLTGDYDMLSVHNLGADVVFWQPVPPRPWQPTPIPSSRHTPATAVDRLDVTDRN